MEALHSAPGGWACQLFLVVADRDTSTLTSEPTSAIELVQDSFLDFLRTQMVFGATHKNRRMAFWIIF